MSDNKNELTQHTSQAPALAMDEKELLGVLQSSLYTGASEASVKLVVGYCKATGLDVMQKPVHIVPMWDRESRSMRDVIMPGIGLYRTQASRSGEYAGVSDPEFGQDTTETIDGCTITYPISCKVVVKRLLSNGVIADFSATERWKENYAVKGGQQKSQAPNAMWYKRPYAQLAKCAEAQALRKAFPECGSQPTADEMEGKQIDITDEVNSHSTSAASTDAAPRTKEDVLKDIEWAKSEDELRKVAGDASKLSDDERKEVKAAYRTRLNELKNMEKVIDGEVVNNEAE